MLKKMLDGEINAVRADKKIDVPVVTSCKETAKVIANTGGTPQLVAKLMYGSGLHKYRETL